MATNRFQNIYNQQPWVSSYVELPLEAISRQGAMKQQQHDINEAERIELLGKQYNALARDREAAMKAKQEIEQTADKFSTLDFTDPTVKQQWSKTKRDIANRFGPQGDIGAIQSNYNAHQDYIKGLKERLNKGPKEGGIDETTYNKLANISLDRYQGIGTGGSQGYSQYQGIAPAGYSDIPLQADTLAKGWKENKKATEGWSETSDGKLYKKIGNKTEWITTDEIYNNIKPILEADPMNQAFARQQVMLNTYGQDRFIGVDNKGYQTEYNPEAYKTSLYDGYFDKAAKFAANKYGYLQEEQTSDIKENQGYWKNLDREQANLTTSTQSEGLPGSLIEVPKEISDLEFNQDGSVKPLTTPQYEVSTPNPGGKFMKRTKVDPKFDTEANQRVVNLITKLQTDNPELKGLTSKATIEAYKNSIKSLESESIPLESISNVAAKGIGEAIARNLDQRNIYLYDSKGKTKNGTKDEVLKELNISQDELEKQIKSGIGGYTQAGPSAGSYYVQVKDGDGESRRIMISPDEEMKKIFRTSQAINEARKSLSTVEVKPLEDLPNYSIIVKPEINKSGVPKWTYIEQIKDGDGNILKSNPTTLDNIRRDEREHLKQSGYLGSQVDVTKSNTTE